MPELTDKQTPRTQPAAPAEGVPAGYMRDAAGNLIAVENIRPIDLARHELVLEKAAKIIPLNAALAALKRELLDDIDALVDMSVERYGIHLGGKKGNVTLETFDGKYQLTRQISEHLTFDEGLQAAKALIDQCVRDWSAGSNANLRTLVDHAFRVDKKGRINTGAIWGLRRLEIRDERWDRAMQAIGESIKVSGSCAYVRLYVRDQNDDWQTVSLDMAAL